MNIAELEAKTRDDLQEIAKELGICNSMEEVVTGKQLEEIKDTKI